MANYDAGHYFLTILAPIRMDAVLRDGQSHSRRHLIREALAALPTAENTIASRGTNPNPPFARNQATHFARFVVLDDVPYNGKVARDSLVTTLLGAVQKFLPAAWQPQAAALDQLSTPYLIFTADFDAASRTDAALATWLTSLWADMQTELQAIFQHCIGFETVRTAADFVAYMQKCQVETTMPFNDYWVPTPALQDISLTAYLYPGLASLALFVLAILWSLLSPGRGVEMLALVSLLAVLSVAGLAIRAILAAATTPFPTATLPATLPNVLKAVYLQRAFTGFAIATQGQSDDDLYSAFGGFLATHRPDDAAPTQLPGVIGA